MSEGLVNAIACAIYAWEVGYCNINKDGMLSAVERLIKYEGRVASNRTLRASIESSR